MTPETPSRRKLRRVLKVAIVLLTPFLVELGAQVVFRARFGFWLSAHQPALDYSSLFERHPWRSVALRPNARLIVHGKQFSHSSQGFRGGELRSGEGLRRILALGGSSTYGTGVADDETWPSQLERELGAPYEVVNLGCPGYTTVENLIQLALLTSDLRPETCIFYEGWNDLRSSHFENAIPDYSEFHGRSQPDNLGLRSLRVGNSLASLQIGRLCLAKAFALPADRAPGPLRKPERYSGAVDARALELYTRNLRLIIALCRAQNIRPVLVPQLLNYEILTSDSSTSGWVPLVADSALRSLQSAYNDRMLAVAREEKAECVGEVLESEFRPADFVDEGHLSAAGGSRFARIIKARLITPR